jgi:hypothetical protein
MVDTLASLRKKSRHLRTIKGNKVVPPWKDALAGCYLMNEMPLWYPPRKVFLLLSCGEEQTAYVSDHKGADNEMNIMARFEQVGSYRAFGLSL